MDILCWRILVWVKNSHHKNRSECFVFLKYFIIVIVWVLWSFGDLSSHQQQLRRNAKHFVPLIWHCKHSVQFKFIKILERRSGILFLWNHRVHGTWNCQRRTNWSWNGMKKFYFSFEVRWFNFVFLIIVLSVIRVIKLNIWLLNQTISYNATLY